MLQKQRRVYEGLSVEFSKEQAEKVEKELRDCENIIKILEEELAAKTPAINVHLQTTSSNIKMLTGKCPNGYLIVSRGCVASLWVVISTTACVTMIPVYWAVLYGCYVFAHSYN